MRFGILGALEVTVGELQLPLRSIKQRSLLALLLCQHGKVAHSDALIDALWGAEAGDAGGQRLRLQLHRLRRTLGEKAPIAHRSAGYELRVPAQAVDAWRFEDLVRQGRQAIESWNDTKGSQLLQAALDMWRGPALSGLNDIPLLHQHATRLGEQRLAALADRVEADLRLRRHGELIAELSDLVREHPLREKFRAQLMIALYRSGRQADALEAYRDGRRVLTEDLGLEPSAELRRLQGAILARDPSLSLEPPSRGPSSRGPWSRESLPLGAPSSASAAVGRRPVHRRATPQHVTSCPHCARRVR